MESTNQVQPINVVVLGMAGAGKTTFVNKLVEYLVSQKKTCYTVNLDPAVYHVPYPCNIDIRDTVKFKEVMKQYGFGPNGAIMTSLNFFTAKFNSLIDILKKNEGNHEFIIFDTPGQIEVFTWSASGIIITEALSNLYPTIVIYLIDTVRCHSPTTFMSNMLYACSITYRMRLPLLCVFNKTDVMDCEFALEWMKDFEKFQQALAVQRGQNHGLNIPEMDDINPTSLVSPYLTGLANSMSLVLDEFYSEIQACGVSSLEGSGFNLLLDKFMECKIDFIENYLPQKSIRSRNPALKTNLLDLKNDSDDSVEENDEQSLIKPEENNKFWEKDGAKSLRHYIATEIKKNELNIENPSKTSMLIDLGGTSDSASIDAITGVDDGFEQRPHELVDEESIDISQNLNSKLKFNENS